MYLINLIVALGYVSRVSHITFWEFGYLAPITVFGYCFLANDVMVGGGGAHLPNNFNSGTYHKKND